MGILKRSKFRQLEVARNQISRVKYEVNNNGCHIPSNRTPNTGGYINTQFENKQIHLHRLVAFVYHGLDLENENELALHKNECHDRRCFNENHIYVGNHSNNTNDAVDIKTNFCASKTHCPKGHLLDKVKYTKGKLVGRYCSECRRIDGREYYQRRKLRVK